VDGSVWERTVYLHSLVVAVGRPPICLERPICGTFPFRSRALKIGQNFYRSQLKKGRGGHRRQGRAEHDARSP
jgi:hypothetical protein